ncbi:MAG: transketolase family protein [Candidatus Diapherotrites archaeon]|nr:transketolase family protein [Candidatus Diapherotrites archaeon]
MENERKATREGYGDALLELGKQNKNVVALDADLAKSTKSNKFGKQFPERFFDVGIAEQDLIGTSVGLSITGKIPFASSFAIFICGRGYEPIRNALSYSSFNVKLAGSHSGLMTGEDGATHQCIEDISLMRVIPTMKVIQPLDYWEAYSAVFKMSELNGPMYLRLCREKSPVFFDSNYEFELGKSNILMEGKDASIIGCGPILENALIAAELLKEKNISVEVINMASIKPLDEKQVLNSANKTGLIFSLEDHSILGGLGSSISEFLSSTKPTKVVRIGVPDLFGESGKPKELWHKYGLDAESIMKTIELNLKEK